MNDKLGESDKDKAKRKVQLQKKYGQRITIARQGRDAFMQKDYIGATKKYNEYLSILAQMNDQEDIYKLSPVMFDNKKEVTEMLLISHIYWEIARINEMTPKLQKNFQKAIDQFVKFTINQPFQVLNAEMLRKYIKKNKNTSAGIQSLTQAYNQIFVQSKKCYIATMCYGETHPNTQTLRQFKQVILRHQCGLILVEQYYIYSSRLVNLAGHSFMIKQFLHIFVRPILNLFSFLLRRFVFNQRKST